MDRKFYSNNLGSIQIFCKSAELESFSAAAVALGITPAAVSRSIARIESRMGVRLFARSTRHIRLTDEGKLYYDECIRALQQLEAAERLLTGGLDTPRGTLRISVPTTYGHCRVMPVIHKYRRRYPEVALEINISNRNIDFIEEGYDLAIRLGQPKDSRLIARKLEDAQLGIYAAPEYLMHRGTPQTLDDLPQHDCIHFIMPATGKPMPWTFHRDGNEVTLDIHSSIHITGDVLGCITYAAAGGGLVQTYDFIAAQKQYGNLVEVLKPYRGASRSFSVLYPHTRILAPKTRAFIDLLVEECGNSKN
ncbi:LysR family transcriptional regulator [Cellvibrio mixtus]|uniref:LysR family transcriptional regulator n=1 Tax=Cellvibrio mixtus TaxID=39650 RepID=UPI000586CB0B|nr:LysR family transcriptional regulator [Cellvibrio mixtus]